jgi:D-beta-D-heptose 7-phosphate kinase/D-beta-D-heptose 1-phosphate adenosyltransferase
MHIYASLGELKNAVDNWKQQGLRVVFTNGVFDILHIGHVTYLEAARALGDKLVVGINNDESVRRLNKGPERPINPEHARAAVIAGLRSVDAVIIFGEDTPLEVIQTIMPSIVAKGGDYNPDQRDASQKDFIVGSEEMRSSGGQTIAIPLVEGFSTTAVVRKMRDSG